jgi:hypothetical protein
VSVRLGVATGDPVAPAEPLKPLRLAAEDPVCDWPVAGSTGSLLESVGEGLAEEQVGLAEALGLVEAAELPGADEPPAPEELPVAVGLAEAEAEVCEGLLADVLGAGVCAGGRLDLGGRTLVTSLTTGSGLSGRAEAPSR